METDTREAITRDHEVGVGLVVAEEDVVARGERLDQVVLEDQRLGLRARHGDLDGGHLRQHQLDARAVIALLKIARDALAQVAGLAHVEDLVLRVEHAIDAGLVRQAGDQGGGIEHGRRGADPRYGGEASERRAFAVESRVFLTSPGT
jgi:hypothetical protein